MDLARIGEGGLRALRGRVPCGDRVTPKMRAQRVASLVPLRGTSLRPLAPSRSLIQGRDPVVLIGGPCEESSITIVSLLLGGDHLPGKAPYAMRTVREHMLELLVLDSEREAVRSSPRYRQLHPKPTAAQPQHI